MAGESYNKYGFHPESPDAKISYFPIAASQTWVKGDMLYNNAGAITIAAAATATLLGPAADDQTTPTTGTLVPVYANPDEVFIGRADADASSLVAGSEIDLVGATGAQQIDVGASTTDVFVFLSVVEGQTSSSAGALLRVKINETVHDLLQ